MQLSRYHLLSAVCCLLAFMGPSAERSYRGTLRGQLYAQISAET